MSNQQSDQPDFSLEDLNVNWDQWLEFDQQLRQWRQQNTERYLTVTVDVDLPFDDAAFDTLRFVDRVLIQVENHTDGRVFSVARQLRDNVGFAGEIKASGDILPDQVRFLQRCGVDTVEIPYPAQIESFFDRGYQPGAWGYGDHLSIREARRSCSE